MNRSLRIVAADDEAEMRTYLRETLEELGHQLVAVAADGEELIELCRAERPELVITDIKMPRVDGIDAAKTIYRELTLPVILVSAYHDPALIERAEADHIMGYLVKPIKQADLETAIGLAVCRFEQFQTLRKESADLRQALDDRKIIERAKGALMRIAGLSEEDAFKRLQDLASEKNQKMVKIAESILSVEDAFEFS